MTGHRNRAMAYLMLNFGMISDNIEETLDLYFQIFIFNSVLSQSMHGIWPCYRQP